MSDQEILDRINRILSASPASIHEELSKHGQLAIEFNKRDLDAKDMAFLRVVPDFIAATCFRIFAEFILDTYDLTPRAKNAANK